MNLTIQNTAEGVRVGVTGDLTGPGATAFAEQFKEKVPEGSAAAVDFSGVGSVDIEGLRKLITVDRWLKGRGGKLVLSGVNGEVMNLLKANGVQSMFQIEEGGPRASAPTPPPPVAPAEEITAPVPPPAAYSAPPPRVEAPPERRAAAPPERSAPPPAVTEDASAWARPPVRETPQAASSAPPSLPRQSPPPRDQDETAAWARPAPRQAAPSRAVPPMPEPPAAAAGAWDAAPPPPARSAAPPSLPATPAPAASPGGWDAAPAPAPPPPRRTPPSPPAPAAAADDAWRAPTGGPKGPPAMPVSGVPELPDRGTIWGRPGTTGTAASGGKSKSKSKGGGKGLIIGLAALALVGGGGFAVWKFLGAGQPKTASFSVAPKEVVLEVGTRAEFTISAINADEIRMEGKDPAGLTFKSSASGDTATGSFSGEVAENAVAAGGLTLSFTAMLNGTGYETRSVKFLAANPVKIDQTAFAGEVGKALPGNRLASGAEECSLDPLPAWAKVEAKTADGKKVWTLTGTPTDAGEVKAKVTAKAAAGGEPKTESITISVRPAAPVVADTPPVTAPPVTSPPETGGGGETGPPPTTPSSTDTPPQTPPAGTPPPGLAETPPVFQAKEIPPQLRRMIQARMDAMSTARLPEKLRIQINNGLSFVEAVEVIGGVTFPSGSTELNAAAQKRIGDALSSPPLREMLESGRSQILVVGYASPQGSEEANLKLSRNRAESVARYLQDIGHEPRFHDGYGETTVVGPDSAAANQAVEIYIVRPSSTYTDPLQQLVDQLNNLRQRMTAEEAP